MTLDGTCSSGPATGTICQTRHCTGWHQKFGQRGHNTGPRHEHSGGGGELRGMAQIGPAPADQVEFQNLARAYLRLADKLSVIKVTRPTQKRIAAKLGSKPQEQPTISLMTNNSCLPKE